MNPLLFTSLMSYLHMEQAYGHSLNQTLETAKLKAFRRTKLGACFFLNGQ